MDCPGSDDVACDLIIGEVFSVDPCFASCYATHSKLPPPLSGRNNSDHVFYVVRAEPICETVETVQGDSSVSHRLGESAVASKQ
jgi:hypothetical protein